MKKQSASVSLNCPSRQEPGNQPCLGKMQVIGVEATGSRRLVYRCSHCGSTRNEDGIQRIRAARVMMD